MWPAPWKGIINDLASLRAFLVPESVNRSLKWANIYLWFTVGQALYWRLHLIPSFDYFIISSTPGTGTMSSFLSLRTDFLCSEVPRSWQWIVELTLSWNRPWKASQRCFFSSRRSRVPWSGLISALCHASALVRCDKQHRVGQYRWVARDAMTQVERSLANPITCIMVGCDHVMHWGPDLEQYHEGKVCILHQQRPWGWEKSHDEWTWSFRGWGVGN